MADSRRTRQASAPASGDLIWQALERELGPPVATERPPDSVTATEFAAKYGVDPSTASNRLNRLVAAGKLSRASYRAPGANRSCLLYTAVQP